MLAASFDSGADGFAYADDAFRGTAQPDYASGAWIASGGHQGGALQVSLGGIDTEIVTGMSGGWSRELHGRRGRPGERLLLVQADPVAGLRGG